MSAKPFDIVFALRFWLVFVYRFIVIALPTILCLLINSPLPVLWLRCGLRFCTFAVIYALKDCICKCILTCPVFMTVCFTPTWVKQIICSCLTLLPLLRGPRKMSTGSNNPCATASHQPSSTLQLPTIPWPIAAKPTVTRPNKFAGNHAYFRGLLLQRWLYFVAQECVRTIQEKYLPASTNGRRHRAWNAELLHTLSNSTH